MNKEKWISFDEAAAMIHSERNVSLGKGQKLLRDALASGEVRTQLTAEHSHFRVNGHTMPRGRPRTWKCPRDDHRVPAGRGANRPRPPGQNARICTGRAGS